MPIHPIEERQIKVKQHIPAFVSGLQPTVHYVESPEKILNVEFLKNIANHEDHVGFGISSYLEDTFILLELTKDKKHYVVAFIEGLTEEEAYSIAPKWSPPQQEKKEDK